MAQITIRNLDDEVLAAHRRRAASQGRTLTAALRDLITAGARGFSQKPPRSREELIESSRRIRAMQPRPVKEPSWKILQESRDERDARIEAAMRGYPEEKRPGE